MRRFTLVLASDLRKRNWICHSISNNSDDLHHMDCVPPGVMVLPKSEYPGTVDPTPVFKRSCTTGIMGEFRFVILDISPLGTKFNLV